MKNYIEKANWITEFPDSGNNDGYIYGIAYVDFERAGDIMEWEWFKTEEEREKAIQGLENVKIINHF